MRTDKPITLRAPAAVRDVLRAAAKASGKTLTDFLLEAGLEKTAHQVCSTDVSNDRLRRAHDALREKGLR